MDAPRVVAHRVDRMGGFGGIGERQGCRGRIARHAAIALMAVVAVIGAPRVRAEALPAETVASAPVPALTIHWTAPPECPTLEDVQGLLETVVPDEVRGRLDGTEADVHIEALEDGTEGYRAHVRVTRGTFVGDRELDGRRCEDVARSAIIVVSVALSEAAEHGDDVAPERVPLNDVELDIVPLEPDAAHAPEAHEAHDRADVSVGVGMISGIGSSAVAPRVDVGASFPGPGPSRFGVRLGIVPRMPVEDGGVVAARLSVITVAPVACVFSRPGATVRFGGCARLDVGLALARGESVPSATRGASGWLAFALTPTVDVGRGRVRLRLTLELETRLLRPKLVVGSAGTIDRTPILAGGGGLGVVFVIP